jgi:hypothetical protein
MDIKMINLKEYILEAVQNTYIFEMAHNRKQIKDRVEGLIDQILQNWCLIKYVKIVNPLNYNINHWKKELESHIDNIFSMQLKDGNDIAKYNLINSLLHDTLEINTGEDIYLRIRKKFKSEGFTNEDCITIVCSDCIEELNTIIKLMSNKRTNTNQDKIDEYIDKL